MIYKYDFSKIHEAVTRYRFRAILLSVVGYLAGVALSLSVISSSGNSIDSLIKFFSVFSVFYGIYVFFIIRTGRRNLVSSLKKIEYEITDDRIIFINGDFKREILFSDVKSIQRHGKHAVVVKSSKNLKINLNDILENYDEVLAKLETVKKIGNGNAQIVISIFMWIFMLGFLFSAGISFAVYTFFFAGFMAAIGFSFYETSCLPVNRNIKTTRLITYGIIAILAVFRYLGTLGRIL